MTNAGKDRAKQSVAVSANGTPEIALNVQPQCRACIYPGSDLRRKKPKPAAEKNARRAEVRMLSRKWKGVLGCPAATERQKRIAKEQGSSLRRCWGRLHCHNGYWTKSTHGSSDSTAPEHPGTLSRTADRKNTHVNNANCSERRLVHSNVLPRRPFEAGVAGGRPPL